MKEGNLAPKSIGLTTPVQFSRIFQNFSSSKRKAEALEVVELNVCQLLNPVTLIKACLLPGSLEFLMACVSSPNKGLPTLRFFFSLPSLNCWASLFLLFLVPWINLRAKRDMMEVRAHTQCRQAPILGLVTWEADSEEKVAVTRPGSADLVCVGLGKGLASTCAW